MEDRPEFVTDEMLQHLDELSEAEGVTPYMDRLLRDVFTDLTPEQAFVVLKYWHNDRHPDE
jgi:hypothetical protein